MRAPLTRLTVLPLCLGLAVTTLAGCAEPARPLATAELTPGAAAPVTPLPAFDASTPTGALMLAAADELAPTVLPAGFHFVETVVIDRSESTSSIYVQGEPGEQGPGLYVHAVHAGVEVAHLGDDWTPEAVPELSGTMPVTVVSDPEGQERSVVSIDASPAGVVRLIGDGVPRDELIAMAGRLLASVG
ncbi:hypothetical protein H9623_02000 [Oerskovia sp. Sa1BUA8]|uniref:Uncharacterized protein n=1 Tax=Oerskovia douganii TaxID=2762210 RepID=A0A9D5U9Z3_9CELL|nr:hypothetical protein [Oerskovia douganii]MBE7699081.1 hypothetical protein [Oerskovia douganii]